jgi:hypothetical protein
MSTLCSTALAGSPSFASQMLEHHFPGGFCEKVSPIETIHVALPSPPQGRAKAWNLHFRML